MSMYDNLGINPEGTNRSSDTPSESTANYVNPKKIGIDTRHRKIQKKESSEKLKKITEQIIKHHENKPLSRSPETLSEEMEGSSAPLIKRRLKQPLSTSTASDTASIGSEVDERELLDNTLSAWALKQIDENPQNGANVQAAIEAIKLAFDECENGQKGKLLLVNLNLTELPDIFHFKAIKSNLKTVDISHNNIKSVPDTFFLLDDLKYANLSKSGVTIATIPEKFHQRFMFKSGVTRIFN